jgi:hypothetical protein
MARSDFWPDARQLSPCIRSCGGIAPVCDQPQVPHCPQRQRLRGLVIAF